ncbi:MAG: DnaD domain protein [Peptococcaceae bacterium]|jgi:DnaD/phage-associated family protein|nr:DnaD domain protein [Peptococcaceae bacterium]
MNEARFAQFLQERGQLALPLWLLEKYQALDIRPEELGCLVLALYRGGRQQETAAAPALTDAWADQAAAAQDPWLGQALEKGWADWRGEGKERRVVFDPLWRRLYELWLETEKENTAGLPDGDKKPGDFDYSRIVKELDRLRGNLGATIREKQFIQELNLRYGWSTDFILNFFRLCCHRGLSQIKNYQPLARQIHRAGIYTLESLAAFMDEVDWIQRQAAEIKKDYLGLYGMVTVTERDYYVKWHVTWRQSHGIIVRAARETTGAANASFKYLDKILEDWHQQGLDTLEACEEAIQRRAREKEAAIKENRAEKGKTTPSKGRRQVERGGDSPWAGYEDNDT